MAAAQIHQGGGQQIRRGGKGQELGDAQEPSAWKAAVGEQPPIGGSKEGANAGGAKEERNGAANLLRTISPQACGPIPQPLHSCSDQSDHRQQRQ